MDAINAADAAAVSDADAQAQVAIASQWAANGVNVTIPSAPGSFSAYHWAMQSKNYATQAAAIVSSSYFSAIGDGGTVKITAPSAATTLNLVAGTGMDLTYDGTTNTVAFSTSSPAIAVTSPLTISIGGGTATVGLSTTGISAGSVGGSNAIPVIAFDAYGRAIAATTVAPAPAWNNIQGIPNTLSGFGITDALVTSTTSQQVGYFGSIKLVTANGTNYLSVSSTSSLGSNRNFYINTTDADTTLTLPSTSASVSGANTGDQTAATTPFNAIAPLGTANTVQNAILSITQKFLPIDGSVVMTSNLKATGFIADGPVNTAVSVSYRVAGVTEFVAGISSANTFSLASYANGSLVGLVYTVDGPSRQFDFKISPSVNGQVLWGQGSQLTQTLYLALALGTPPVVWAGGTLIDTPEPGAMEYDGLLYYVTDSNSNRQSLITSTTTTPINTSELFITAAKGATTFISFPNAPGLGLFGTGYHDTALVGISGDATGIVRHTVGGNLTLQAGAATSTTIQSNGGTLYLTGGAGGSYAQSSAGSVSISGGVCSSSAGSGGSITISASAALRTGSGSGGSVTISAGQGGTSTGASSGSVTIRGGQGASAFAGGFSVLTGGTGGAGAAGGNAYLAGGNGGSSATGGAAVIKPGNPGSGYAGAAPYVEIQDQNGVNRLLINETGATSIAGPWNWYNIAGTTSIASLSNTGTMNALGGFTSYSSSSMLVSGVFSGLGWTLLDEFGTSVILGATSSATSNGSDIAIQGGTSGSTSGVGGNLKLYGGNGVTTNGGFVSIRGGNPLGTNGAGGSVEMLGANGNGTGAGGAINIVAGTGGANAGSAGSGTTKVAGGQGNANCVGGLAAFAGGAGGSGANGGNVILVGGTGGANYPGGHAYVQAGPVGSGYSGTGSYAILRDSFGADRFRINEVGATSIAGPWSWWNTAGNSQIASLDNTGHLTIAGTLTQSSDRRLKTDIESITNAENLLMALDGVRYHRKDLKDGILYYGFIADQVEDVMPEVVRTDYAGYKSVEYTAFIPVLVEGTRDLYRRIHHLEAQIADLKRAQ